MKDICGIYIITNIVNKKCIIGQSIHINLRLRQHKALLRKSRHTNTYFQRAWNKYGENNFLFEILLECTEDCLDKEEIRLIKEYNSISRSKGYNLTEGGHRPKFSDETRIKMSQSKIGKKSGQENHMYGKHHSNEARKKMSENNKGMTGKHHSEESNLKNRLAHLGKHCSEETKSRISKSTSGENHSMYGKHRSNETKNKISKTLTGRKKSEEELSNLRKIMSSEKTRKKMREAWIKRKARSHAS